MTSKAKLTEVIRRRIAGGNPAANDRVKDAEIQRAIAAAANKILKTEALSNFTQNDDSLLDGILIATYENLQVEPSNGNYCRVKLPATPLTLPDKMGVYSVYPSGEPWKEFLPVPVGVYNILMGEKMLSSINKVVYTYENRYITVYKDIKGDDKNTVDVKLAIADIDQMEDHDPLPLSPDMEADVITYVLNLYLPES